MKLKSRLNLYKIIILFTTVWYFVIGTIQENLYFIGGICFYFTYINIKKLELDALVLADESGGKND